MKLLRRTLVVVGSGIFAWIWTGVVSVSLSPFLILLPDEALPMSVPLLLISLTTIWAVLAVCFARAHWTVGWPVGGILRIPGRRDWTIAFLGGALVLTFCALFPPSVSEPESIAIVGGAGGPTSIYLKSHYSTPFFWSHSMAVVLAALTIAAVALASRKTERGEPGATDNPDDAQ